LPNPPPGQQHAMDDHVGPYIAAAADGSFVVTWTRGSATCTDTSTSGPCEVRARWFDAGGGFGPEVTIPARLGTTAILPVAVAVPGGYLFLWRDKLRSGPDTDSFAIVARRFDGAGAAMWPGQAVVNTITIGEQSAPAVAAQADGSSFAAWTDCSQKGLDT